jgi:hypothetical protein
MLIAQSKHAVGFVDNLVVGVDLLPAFAELMIAILPSSARTIPLIARLLP